MSQGAWQKWDDEEYIDYLERYYGMQFTNAKKILKSAMLEETEALLITVFNKIASPSVYVQPHFKAWNADQSKGAQVTATVQETTPQPTRKEGTPWRQSKNPSIEWCPEQEASADDVQKAMDKEVKEMWYTPPRGDYQHGSIFRKVKA